MESGNKAVVIIIIAMMLTAGVGFFFNFDERPDTKTEYTPIGNMDALISANSDRTQESELYNSTYNVTNWKIQQGTQWIPNPDIVRLPSGQANSYIITDEYEIPHNTNISFDVIDHGITTHVETFYNDHISSSDIDNYNGFITTNNSLRYWPQNASNLVLGTSVMDDSGGAFIGGYGQLDHERYRVNSITPYDIDRYTYLQFYYNDALYSYIDGNYLTFVPLSAIVDMNSIITAENRNDKFEISPTFTGVQFFADPTITTQLNVGPIRPTEDYENEYRLDTLAVTVTTNTPAMDNLSYLRYDVSTHGWVAYDANNQRIRALNELYIISTDSSITSYPFTFTHYTVVPATYADPTKYVPIDETSIWTNYDLDLSDPLNPHTTFVNTEVSILFKGTGTIAIGGIANQPNNYNIANAVQVTKNGTMYVVNGTAIGEYLGLRITLSALTNSITVEGIVTDNSPVSGGGSGGANTPTYNYVLSGVSVTVPHTYTMPDIYRLKVTPGTGTEVYIEDTYILSDPNQVLWKDVNIDLGDYFPDDMNHLRVLLQGFVRYGTSIIINEQTFQVTDGKFTVTQNGKSTTFILNGTAIDYLNNHVYIAQSNGKANVDLGEVVTTTVGNTAVPHYTIEMIGVWYFSTTASQISTVDIVEKVWTPGWMMDMNTTVLTFVGCIFGSLVIMALRFREELEVLDVIVLILTMLIASSLLVIT